MGKRIIDGHEKHTDWQKGVEIVCIMRRKLRGGTNGPWIPMLSESTVSSSRSLSRSVQSRFVTVSHKMCFRHAAFCPEKSAMGDSIVKLCGVSLKYGSIWTYLYMQCIIAQPQQSAMFTIGVGRINLLSIDQGSAGDNRGERGSYEILYHDWIHANAAFNSWQSSQTHSNPNCM